ncbi:MAG: nitroreductase family protein [Candidatus Woesearchaeota archaeon]|nr:nitroreductase family protein [Candidatus Woesearchaeota archaeon]MDP7198314.1 nitroreductase family protein [Candidatus Woesearchaeota archaeon]MDP7467416.1 nitroreductase family protein [Candidatus Woesearchaeota archaeon]MDP7647643.1 nitroreductase family protein [Candidatus Woesearchaeota archaeon]
METLECIRTRRSIRSYTDQQVEMEKIGNILDAGRLAPSAGNLQAWKFILVTNDGSRKTIAEACMQQFWMEEAPIHIIVCSERAKVERMYDKKEVLYSTQNCAVAAENMLLAAHDQGLGACMVCAIEEAAIRRLMKLPDGVVPEAIITVGYADELPEPVPKYYIDNVTFLEKWGNRVADMADFLGYHSHKIPETIKQVKKAIKKRLKK